MPFHAHQRNNDDERTPLIRQNSNTCPSPSSCDGDSVTTGIVCEDKHPTETCGPDHENIHHSHFIDIPPSRFWVVFGCILLSIILSFFDGSILESIHPVISSHFHFANSASWLSTGFLLTCTVFQPIFGQISDIFGRRVPYLTSILIFLISTIWCGAAWNFSSFLAARLFCGVGASGVTSLGAIICSDLIHIEHRGIYQSYISLAYGLGNCLGLAFGGVIVDSLGWRAVFGIQLPMICALFLTVYLTLPSNLGPQLARERNISILEALSTIDTAGSFFLVVGVTALMLGLNLGGNVFPWSHPIVICSLITFCLVSVPFVKTERSSPNPAIPLPLLTKAPHANLILGNFLAGVSINTILFNAPLFFQAVKLESATGSGFRLLPASVGLMMSSLLTGIFMAKSGRLKLILLLGVFWLIISCVCSGMLSTNLPDWVSVTLIAMAAFSQGALYPPSMMGVLSTSAQDDQAVITTTLSLLRSLGWVMGVAVSSLVLQNSLGAFLHQTVTGPNKADIIIRVRKSITEIAHLDATHKPQGTVFSISDFES
ncbi:hypothetical protein AJ78_08407 [Emergomyces pasteurianus Ep9510]|uniref:Major facilitator superfamily (MFS) profile domain-containing protein n=1 Tax=Emergomyces pasteurianus Ep9510 TaxID=1447872 RepID=A0A1J9P2N8_9EURO|nr:hypothetical protein AJ78_08407 [Emergomyces pasteurianus Ep9510]